MDPCLSEISTQFLCCYPARFMKWPKELSADTQSKIVESTIRNHMLGDMPVSKQYMISFIKALMAQIEINGYEIGDEVYEAYGNVLSQPESGSLYKHYVIQNEEKDPVVLSLQETNNLVSEGTTGLLTWQASKYLAEFLLSHGSGKLIDKKIVELGCGLGFLGLVVCKSFSCSQYVFTDHHPSVLKKLGENIDLNKELLCKTEVKELDWSKYDERECLGTVQHADTILAADVVFDIALLEPLAHTIKLLLQCGNAESQALVCSTIRNIETYNTFKHILDNLNLTYKAIPDGQRAIFHYNREASPIEILEISLPN